MYTGAPYNFGSLPEYALEYDKNTLPSVSALQEGNYTGDITYTICAKTPLFVGDVNGDHFYKNIDGDYAIKSSTVRGLIHANMQILGHASITDDVDGSFKMMYRKVGSPASDLKKTYETTLGMGIMRTQHGTVSLRKNVKAGVLVFDKTEKNSDKAYSIYPSAQAAIDAKNRGKQNYYICRENDIIGALQRQKKNTNSFKGSGFEYLLSSGMNVLMHDHTGRYPFGKNGFTDRNAFNPSFRPSFKEISFHVGLNGKIDQVDAPGKLKGRDCYDGYFVSSGYMQKKKTHYVIRKENTASDARIQVPEDAVRAYRADFESRKNLFGTTQSTRGLSFEEKKNVKKASQDFYKLPDKTLDRKPVFYIEDKGRIYFGFTPNLRLYFDYTIEDAIPESQKVKLDYAKAIMGYTSNDKEMGSRKSRVSFSDAVVVGPARLGKNQNMVLGGPKPTSFYDYLSQPDPNHVMTYNDEESQIRGYKQYWLREKATDFSSGEGRGSNAKVESGFAPLQAGTVFKGIIHFTNLREDELGLLLWSIALEKESEMNVGKAKAYGYGRIKVTIDDLKLLDYEKMYKADLLDFSPYQTSGETKATVETMIASYKKTISDAIGYDIMKDPSVGRFLLMKNSKMMPDEADIRYMSMQNGDYRDRENEKVLSKRYLPLPEEVVKKKYPNAKFDFVAASPKSVKKAADQKGTTTKTPKNDAAGRSLAEAAKAAAPADPVFVGAVVEGVVNNYLRKGNVINGAFMTLPGMKKGLLHVSEAKNSPSSYQVGKKYKVKVIAIDAARGSCKLSDKALED